MSFLRVAFLFLVVLVLLPLLVFSVQARDQAQALQQLKPSHGQPAAEAQLLSPFAPVPASDLTMKGHPKLESSLVQLVDAFEHGGVLKAASAGQSAGIKLRGDTVRVIIEAQPGKVAEVVDAAEALAGAVEGSAGSLVQAVVPLPSLVELASREEVRYVRQPIRFLPLAVGSEGVGVSGVPSWRSAGLTGAGVKVAVVDFGFTGYGSLLGTELPSQVVARSFRSDGRMELPEEGDQGRHGTGCAEIVYDMAPGAQLYLISYETEVELAQAVDWLIAQGINVVSFSIGGLWGRGDGTGPVDDIVAKAADAGVVWVNAAGNSAQEHWSGQWSDATAEGLLDFAPGHPVNGLLAVEGDTMIVYLRWDDPFDASCNDYDLYIVDPDLLLLADPFYRSTNVQNCSSHPIEEIVFVAPYTGVFYVAVFEAASTRSPKFDLFFRPVWCFIDCPMLQYKTTSGSLEIPGDSARALTVGAVPWNSPNTIEDFSSQGPTTDGRIKPDLVAPDRVSTSSYGGYSLFNAGFPGTSASAPHVAGAAALVKQANPSFSPQQIKAFLESRAVDLGVTGKDNVYGAGRLALGPPPSPTPTPTRTPTATATPQTQAQLLNCPSPGRWSMAVWAGAAGTSTADALRTCGEGHVAMAYGLDSATQSWTRHFSERPEVSSMLTLGGMQAIFALGAGVTSTSLASAAPSWGLPSADAAAAAAAASLAPTPAPTSCPDVIPGTYHGTVTVDGNLAPNGTAVTARVGEREWSTVVRPDGTYAMDVPVPYAPTTPPCFAGGTVSFRVDGRQANETAVWALGLHDLDLTVPSSGTPTPTPAPSKVMLNCPLPGKWSLSVWKGSDGTPTADALGTCAAAPVAAAYWLDAASQGWLRYIAGRPEFSNLLTVNNAQPLLTLGSLAAPSATPRIVFASNRDGNYEIYVMNADGTAQANLTNHWTDDLQPAGSPDGSKIAFMSIRDGNQEIYVMNADGSGLTRLTNNSAWDVEPAWSPDGSRIAFQSNRDGNYDIWVMNADGTGQTRLTTSSEDEQRPAWSPDGSKIAFDLDREIYVVNADGTQQTRLTDDQDQASDGEPAWSPDGSKIGFFSIPSSWPSDLPSGMFVMNADGTGRTLLNPDAGSGPAWSPDGSKIAFLSWQGGNYEIYVMNADGTGQTRLTTDPGSDIQPAWLPGGRFLAPPSLSPTPAPTSCPDVVPGTYHGTVTVDGNLAPDGTTVTARAGQREWSTVVRPDGTYALDVPDPLAPTTPPCFTGGTVSFRVDGRDASETAVWALGLHDLDLTIH